MGSHLPKVVTGLPDSVCYNKLRDDAAHTSTLALITMVGTGVIVGSLWAAGVNVFSTPRQGSLLSWISRIESPQLGLMAVRALTPTAILSAADGAISTFSDQGKGYAGERVCYGRIRPLLRALTFTAGIAYASTAIYYLIHFKHEAASIMGAGVGLTALHILSPYAPTLTSFSPGDY